MGKKSRASKAKAGSGPKGGGGGGGGTAGAAGGSLVTSKKAQKCVQCWTTVKSDKGISCPGCSQLFCWRCEKKVFAECPNGTGCILPIWRCLNCSLGQTFLRVMKERDGLSFDDIRASQCSQVSQEFCAYIEQDDALTVHAKPCGKCNGCNHCECYFCFDDPACGQIKSCSNNCGTFFCQPCSKKNLSGLFKTDFSGLYRECKRILRSGCLPSVEAMKTLGDLARRYSGNAVLSCADCKAYNICVACLDERQIVMMLKSMMLQKRFKCSRCYWATKPCANPTCPNDIDTPTKRCGDCHIARYCSIECQAAAYPDHVGRCKKIVAKRNAAAAVAAEKD